MTITLVVAYRDRRHHLDELIRHFSTIKFEHFIEILIVEGSREPSLSEVLWPLPYIKYKHVPMSGAFHKTRLLNIGLSLSTGDYLVPYDVDLLPLNGALSRALMLAQASPSILVSGYRLMSKSAVFGGDVESLESAKEDSPRALKKQIITGECFGVCPIFLKSRLLEVGGWDEAFVGWGAEDQDVIERYCCNQIYLGRFASICYVHLDHKVVSGWNEEGFVEKNRKLYFAKKHLRQQESV